MPQLKYENNNSSGLLLNLCNQFLHLIKLIYLRQHCSFFITAMLMVQLLAGQQPKQYSFTHYGVKNGLAAYNTRSIAQDKTGYIWIGTLNGLQRFDGNRFLTFRNNPGDKNSIPDNYVEQLLVDKFNNLWLVLNDGSIGIFDTRRFVFRKAGVKQANENNIQALRKLVEDSEGNLFYIFPNLELLTYNRKTNEFSAAHNIFPVPLNWKVVNITQDAVTKKYWIGTDSGMAVYNKNTRAISYYGHNTEREPFIEMLGKVGGAGSYKIDKKGRLWFISWPVNIGASRLYCYNLVKNEIVLNAYDLVPVAKKYIEPDYFMEQKDGSIWISGLNVMVKFNEQTKNFEAVYSGYTSDQGISYETANLFEDREQNIWIATSNNGVYVFNPSHQLFTSYKHYNRLNGTLGNGYLLSFAPARNRTTLVGVWGDGIYRYDSKFNNINLDIKGIDEANGLPVWDICRLNDNRTIWLVGQPGFIFVYDEITGAAVRYDPPIFEGRTIRQAVQDKLGNIWLGSNNRGLVKWVPAKAVTAFENGFYKITGIPNVRVKNIIIDSKGFVWVCTNKEGVYKINPANDSIVLHLTKNDIAEKRLLTNDASVAFEYNDSLVIIATGGLNIYNTKNKTTTYITVADGLPSNAVVSMEKDKSGYLWLGLLNGLCRMNLQKKTFTLFDRNDGIANDNFQVAASYQLADGRMMFGSSDDFVVFNPDDVKTNTQPPPVIITGLKLPNRSLPVDSILQLNKVELAASQNSITIGFAALSFVNKNKLVYYYQLEPIDKQWRRADEFNQAVYNYLPPGRYTFKVKVENADGVTAKNITELVIKIKPPFYKTLWFAGMLAFVAIAILYWVDKLRVNRIKEAEGVRTRIATSLTKDMSSTLSNINLLSEMAKIKVERDIERTKDYITQISNNSNRMIEVMDDMIWSINPANDELQYTITRMKRYASEIQSKYNVEISFVTDEKVKDIKLHMDKRHELFLIFKEALLNIGLHAKSKFAAVSIGYEKSILKMKITDNGKGFDTEEISFGRGLNEIRKRALLLKAELNIQSELNTGTTIEVEMKV